NSKSCGGQPEKRRGRLRRRLAAPICLTTSSFRQSTVSMWSWEIIDCHILTKLCPSLALHQPRRAVVRICNYPASRCESARHDKFSPLMAVRAVRENWYPDQKGEQTHLQNRKYSCESRINADDDGDSSGDKSVPCEICPCDMCRQPRRHQISSNLEIDKMGNAKGNQSQSVQDSRHPNAIVAGREAQACSI